MNDILLFLHFIGLIGGFAPGIANMVVTMKVATATPEQGQALRGLIPILANISGAGLAILWITGVIMVWSIHGGPANLPWQFWVKFVFVLIITVLLGLFHAGLARVRRGDMAAAAMLPVIGRSQGVAGLLAMLFAVLAFH